MADFDLESKIEFAKNLSKFNIVNSYDYLVGIYELNKNYLEDKDNLKLLLQIIEFQIKINPQEDISFYFKKALEYAIKYGDKEAIILLYRFYCMNLYKNARLDKCEILIENFISNFQNYTSFQDILKIKEINIAVNSLLKEQVKNEEDFYELLNEEMDPDQVVKIIISFSRKYINTLKEEDIIKLIKIFKIGLDYIIKNKNHFKIFHSTFAELHNMIGNLYYYFGLFNRAQRHFFRAFVESLSNPDVNIFAKFQKNIAISFYELGKIDKANKYFGIIEKLYKKISDPIVLYQFYSVLGLSYLRMGKISLGHSLIQSAIKYRMSIKDYFTLLHTLNYAIIFSLDKSLDNAYNYFLYFEKIVSVIPDSYYYLFYIFYLKLFREKKFNESLFLKKLIKYPIYSLRLIPLFALLKKYKIRLSKDKIFASIINLFINSFKNEIGLKNYDLYKEQYYEYECLYENDNYKLLKISGKLPFIKEDNSLIINWKDFITNKIEKMRNRELIDILYLKLLTDGDIIEYKNKKYKLIHSYKNQNNSNIFNWAKKTLFSRVNLEKITLQPINSN